MYRACLTTVEDTRYRPEDVSILCPALRRSALSHGRRVGVTTRIGVIGFGNVGRAVVASTQEDPTRSLAFVNARRSEALSDLPMEVRAESLDDEVLGRADLVVEAAHPGVVAEHGVRILRTADLLTLSTGALVDDTLCAALIATAEEHGTRLLLPHGALPGVESLLASPAGWRDVAITFVKPPTSIEPAPRDDTERLILYEGPVRGIAARFPRNVNSMVTCALATVGLDRCQARLISDPDARYGSLEVDARGVDGSRLRIHKEQPLQGVSGTEMANSLLHSLRTVTGQHPGLAFV